MRSILPLRCSPSPSGSPRCSSGAERSEPNPTSKRRGASCERRTRLVAHEALEVAPETLLELGLLQLGQLEADTAAQRVVEAAAEEADGALDVLGRDAVVPELLRQSGVELVQGAVRDRPAQHRIDDCVDRLRRHDALEQPRGGAVGEALQLGDAERRLRAEPRQQGVVRDACVAAERRACACEPAAPVVRVGQRARLFGLRDGELCQRAHRSRSVGAASSPQVSADSGLREVARATSSSSKTVGDLFPERARLAWRAVVGRRLADEVEPARRARARGVEEVAVAADLVGALEPAAELAARVVVEERRRARAARQEPSSSPSRKTTSKRRVRARIRSSTATRPASNADPSRTSTRSSDASTSSGASDTPSRVAPRARRAAAGSRRTSADRAGTSRLPAAPRCRTRNAASSG